MKNRLLFIIFCIVVMGILAIKMRLPSSVKDMLIRSPLAEIYVKYVRDGKDFDPDHVITNLDNGMQIIVNKHDRCVCWFIRLAGHWDSNESRVLDQIVQKGYNIVEVGANFGVHTLRMADLVGNKGKVYAFEANPNVSKYLKESVSLNHLNNIVSVFEKAAGDVFEKAFLEFGVANIGGGHIVPSPSDTSISTEMVRLDDIIQEQRIDILKMDAEGCEFKVLQGANNLIERNLDHIIIMMEFVPSHFKSQGSSAEAILQFLRSRGFSVWRIGKKNLGEPLLVSISNEELLKLSEADIVASKRDFIKDILM